MILGGIFKKNTRSVCSLNLVDALRFLKIVDNVMFSSIYNNIYIII